MVHISAEQLFAPLYALLSLFSLSGFGFLAEFCDLQDSCSSRFRAMIAFSVFVFLLSTIMLLAQIMRLSIAGSLQPIITPLLFMLNTVVAALAISPRTNRQVFLFPQEMVWWGQIVCVLLIFLAFTDRDSVPLQKEGLEVQTPPQQYESPSPPPPPPQLQPQPQPQSQPV